MLLRVTAKNIRGVFERRCSCSKHTLYFTCLWTTVHTFSTVEVVCCNSMLSRYCLQFVFVVYCSLITYGTVSYAKMAVIFFCVTLVQSHSTKSASNWRSFPMENGVVRSVSVYFHVILFTLSLKCDNCLVTWWTLKQSWLNIYSFCMCI